MDWGAETMDADTRYRTTRMIWIGGGVMIAAIFLSGMFTPWATISLGHFVIAFMVVIITMVSTGFVWNWGDLPSEAASGERRSSKQKREERLSRLMDELSEEDLEALRLHLEAQDAPQYGLSEDGELRRR